MLEMIRKMQIVNIPYLVSDLRLTKHQFYAALLYLASTDVSITHRLDQLKSCVVQQKAGKDLCQNAQRHLDQSEDCMAFVYPLLHTHVM